MNSKSISKPAKSIVECFIGLLVLSLVITVGYADAGQHGGRSGGRQGGGYSGNRGGGRAAAHARQYQDRWGNGGRQHQGRRVQSRASQASQYRGHQGRNGSSQGSRYRGDQGRNGSSRSNQYQGDHGRGGNRHGTVVRNGRGHSGSRNGRGAYRYPRKGYYGPRYPNYRYHGYRRPYWRPYWRYPRGYVGYPPGIGTVFLTLPLGCAGIYIGGTTYYYYDNVYYRSVPSGYVVVAPPVAEVPQIVSEGTEYTQVSVTASLLNVRSGPGAGNAIIRQVRKGEILDVSGESGGWLYVVLSDGADGWVDARYTAPMVYVEG